MPVKFRLSFQGGAALALIVGLATALRIYGLEIQSLWNDELSSLYRSQGQDLIGVLRNAKSDAHPPLYHLIVWLVSNHIGDDPFYLRLPSAIFGILAVYRVYFLARDARDHRAGLFAAATLAVSYAALFYSQEGRSNSLVVLLTVLSTHAAFHMAEALCHGGRVAPRIIFRLCLWSILLIYAHYFGILTVTAQAFALLVLCLIFSPGRLKSFLFVYLAITVSYLPWLPAMTFQLGRGPLWLKEPTFDDMVRFVEFLIKGIQVQVALAGLLMIAAGAHVVKNFRSASEKIVDRIGPLSVLISVLVLPPIFAFIVSYLVVPVFNDRNLIGILPVMCVMVGVTLSWGLDKWGTRSHSGRLIETALLILPTVVSLFLVVIHYQYYAMPSKEQFREAVNKLVDESRSETNPSAAFCAHNARYLTYYSSRANWHGRFDPMLCDLADLNRIDLHSADAPDELWFIWAHRKPDPLLIAELQKRFSMTLRGRYLKAEVYRVKRRAAR